MFGAPVAASPVPLPEFPVPAAPVDPVVEFEAAATVVAVVDVVELVALPLGSPVEVEAEVAASPSNFVATFRSAATMLGVGGADPKTSSSD